MYSSRIEVSYQIQISRFLKYDGKSFCYAHLKVYGVDMARNGDNDTLLV